MPKAPCFRVSSRKGAAVVYALLSLGVSRIVPEAPQKVASLVGVSIIAAEGPPTQSGIRDVSSANIPEGQIARRRTCCGPKACTPGEVLRAAYLFYIQRRSIPVPPGSAPSGKTRVLSV